MDKTNLEKTQIYQQELKNVNLDIILDKALTEINIKQHQQKRLQAYIGYGWYFSMSGVLLSLLWLVVDSRQSGLVSAIKILFNSFSAVLVNWQDYILSVADILPTYSLCAVFISLAIFIILTKQKNGFGFNNLNKLTGHVL